MQETSRPATSSSGQQGSPEHPVDLRPFLSEWTYDEDAGLQARLVGREDGTRFVQLRVDLGVLHMEGSGRPDGTRPFERPSLLDHYRAELEAHRERTGWYEDFELSPTDCAALRRECFQYYHRRIAYRALQEYAAAVADADHNLWILDLLQAFASRREDAEEVERFRPFILAHRHECLALECVEKDDLRGALIEIERGIQAIRRAFAAQDRAAEAEGSGEMSLLLSLRRELVTSRQSRFRHRLQILLDDALRREDADQVASLRSQLRSLETGE